MALEFRILGPLEVVADGEPVRISSGKQRALLASLLVSANEVVSRDRLIDDLWGAAPPETAENTLQVYVSQLRKTLSAAKAPSAGDSSSTIATNPPGYVIRVEPGQLDLWTFEEELEAGRAALAAGDANDSAERLRAALALWRGPALSELEDADFAQPTRARLDELRSAAVEELIDADLAAGRHASVLAELDELVERHPLRERLWRQLMLALYRSDRQADALATYRRARAVLVDELGIEPGARLQELERAILAQDPALDLQPGGSEDAEPRHGAAARKLRSAQTGEEARAEPSADPVGTILVVGAEEVLPGPLLEIAATLAHAGEGSELLLVQLMSDGATSEALTRATATANEQRALLDADGIRASGTAFTTAHPAADLARLTEDETVELALVAAEGGGTGALTLGPIAESLLDGLSCDIAVLLSGEGREGTTGTASQARIAVPFSGSEHDWTALELAAALASVGERSIELIGRGEIADSRDASRLLATATLALQRMIGVSAESRLAESGTEGVAEAAAGASLMVLGLSERWRSEGVGQARTEIATDASQPVLLVRRGSPGSSLAPLGDLTRFTWSRP